ncbi:hypothetical protein FIU97_10215 [Roseivivax sp. THAF40]|nr:hypothetical protein FIV09_10230 [Roseivivax sp. THAF197b]QFT46946.1 hypothetical protein FIU97_10215 [Roseivivax sp. THAF40]
MGDGLDPRLSKAAEKIDLDATGPVDLNLLFQRLADELAGLETQSQLVEACMDKMLNEARGEDGNVSTVELQYLDRITQTLGELQAFLRRVAQAAPAGVALDLQDATDAVKLGALSEKLQGRVPKTCVEEGSVDLF